MNFRDSKLTRLLREPLSGNYRTIMIAQVNPSLEFKEDAKNTLTFASKAIGITKRVSYLHKMSAIDFSKSVCMKNEYSCIPD